MSEIRTLLANAQAAEVRGDKPEAARLLREAAAYYRERQQLTQAARMLRQARKAEGLPEEKIQQAFLENLSRGPSASEAALARDFVESSISGNATAEEQRDVWARLIQTLWATPGFRHLD